MGKIRRGLGHPITPHSRIGLTPSVADVGSKKRLLRQLPTGVRECEERYAKNSKEGKIIKPFCILVFGLLILLLSGCSPDSDMEFRYSYLNNEEVISFTKSLLHESGIPDKNADRWFKLIELYNAKQAKFVSSTNSG